VTPEDVKKYYGSLYRFNKDTGMSASTLRNWLCSGRIPEDSQYRIERITNGMLKAGMIENEIKKIEDYLTIDAYGYGHFRCSCCFRQWGFYFDGPRPKYIKEKLRCLCGAVVNFVGDWVKIYKIDADIIDDN